MRSSPTSFLPHSRTRSRPRSAIRRPIKPFSRRTTASMRGVRIATHVRFTALPQTFRCRQLPALSIPCDGGQRHGRYILATSASGSAPTPPVLGRAPSATQQGVLQNILKSPQAGAEARKPQPTGLRMSGGNAAASGASASGLQTDPGSGSGMEYGKYDARPI